MPAGFLSVLCLLLRLADKVGAGKEARQKDPNAETAIARTPKCDTETGMNPFRKLLLPSLATVILLLPSCVVAPAPYYGRRAVYAPGVYGGLPPGYDGSYYWYGGRPYYGGRHEAGRFYWQGQYYGSRYYHDGRYYYGGEYRRGGDREHRHGGEHHHDRD